MFQIVVKSSFIYSLIIHNIELEFLIFYIFLFSDFLLYYSNIIVINIAINNKDQMY